MIAACALLLAAATAAPPQGAFTDRAARIDARIADDQSHKRLAPGQDALLRVELSATRRAYETHDPAAVYMLDVIDRQLAEVDHVLSRAEDGRGITVHVGDPVTVALSDGYAWDMTNSDQTVLSVKNGVPPARGVQGVFTAKQPGTAILSLTLRPGVPARVKQPVVFTITVLPRA
jgi:hypothetical protein